MKSKNTKTLEAIKTPTRSSRNVVEKAIHLAKQSNSVWRDSRQQARENIKETS